MKLNKAIVIILICLLSLLSGVAFRFYRTLNTNSERIYVSIKNNIDINNPSYSKLKNQGQFNILIIGEDNVEGSRRSDTILVASIDINEKNIKILSMPRDTRVNIPGHGFQKLNHAFAYGGEDLLKATVEKYLSQPILYYVIVDYDSFPAVVDSFGGVKINVDKRMHYVDHAGKLNIDIKPGIQRMNGEEALHYVRFRKDALGDIGRVQRQQKFLRALLQKAYSPSTVIKIPEITSSIMNLIKTDISPSLAVQLAGFFRNELNQNNIYFSTLKGKPATIDKLSYWIGDVKFANNFLIASSNDVAEYEKRAGWGHNNSTRHKDKNIATQTSIDKKETISVIKSLQSPIAVLNGTGESGIGGKFAIMLQNLGIDVIHTGNAKHFDYKYSNIIYPLDADKKMKDTADSVGKLLNIPESLVRPSKQAKFVSLIIGKNRNSMETHLADIIKVIQH